MNILVDELSERDRQTVGECLRAAEQEDFFPEWEFETLFGISRKEVSIVREKWPDVDISQVDVGAAVIGAMNHLLGYPHGQDLLWKKYISVGPDAIQLTLDKLLGLGL
jgi:hypothetical protein